MSKIKVLVVENELLVAKDMKKILEDSGYSVSAIVSTGQEAVRSAKRFRPDIVLMDVVLPGGLDGIGAARRIRNQFGIPVVFVTAHSAKKLFEAAKRTHPYGYILKPIKNEELSIAIEMALSKHAGDKEGMKIERTLKETEERHRLMVENMNEGIALIDKRGEITYINDKFLKARGYERNQAEGRPLTDFLEQKSSRVFQSHLRQMRKGVRSSCELVWKTEKSSPIHTIVSPTPIFGERGAFRGAILVITDITERRQVEEELNRSREELRNLYQHLHSVREQESKRIAREIHDELGQVLTALKMDLSWLLNHLPDHLEYKNFVHDKTQTMMKLIDKTIHTVQKISAELRPGLLDDLGLLPAIEWQAQDFQSRTEIRCQFQFRGTDLKVDPDCATSLFRILQEALTNIVRHAGASLVKISLREDTGTIELSISDDGRGITQAQIHSPESLGIIGMRERLRPFGGELRLSGIPGKGTTVKVRVPKRGVEIR
jgi:PAS domain S-box-containing protein